VTEPNLNTHVRGDMGNNLSKRFYKGKSMQLGGGGRFAQLSDKLASKGATNPDALAAVIGRKKYGASRMASWAAKGR
jgi:hypothetical protein